jgi:hypothetical protein
MNGNGPWLVAILAFSMLCRVSAALYLGDHVVDLPGTADQVSYHTLAMRVLEGHGFTFGQTWWPLTRAGEPTAHWSYLYTLYLVALYAIFGPHPLIARLVQAIIVGGLHPYLVYRLAEALFLKRSAIQEGNEIQGWQALPLVAAGITAVYGYFVYYAGTLMTEPFYITAILAVLYLAVIIVERMTISNKPGSVERGWGWGMGLGIAVAATVLLRQLFLLFIPFLLLWMVASSFWRKAVHRLFVPLLIAMTMVALTISPFTVYNYLRFGRFVLLNTNAGFAFFWGNHPIYGVHFVAILPGEGPSYQELIPSELRGLNEAALDQALLREGMRFIVEDPRRYALLSLSRVTEYFKFWPSRQSGLISNITRVGSFGLFLPWMLYGLWRSRACFYHPPHSPPASPVSKMAYLSSPIVLAYLFLTIYTGIHLLSWALIRYRLPVDAVLILFAAYGLADMFARKGYGRLRNVQMCSVPAHKEPN